MPGSGEEVGQGGGRGWGSGVSRVGLVTSSPPLPLSESDIIKERVPMWSSPQEASTTSASSTLWRQEPWQQGGARRRTSRGSPRLISSGEWVVGKVT